MNIYTIPESITFLAKEYGSEHMPTSEETLRRAVRTKALVAEEDDAPGRKGYTISESNLRAYGENRLKRIRAKAGKRKDNFIPGGLGKGLKSAQPKQFTELYAKYISGEIASETYYMGLFHEKVKWEQMMKEKQELLVKLDYQRQVIKSDIINCQSAVDAYADGITRYKS